MKFRYDPEVDIIYIRFRDERIAETDEVSPGLLLDIADDGNPVALEILNASKIIGNSDLTVEVEMARVPGRKAV